MKKTLLSFCMLLIVAISIGQTSNWKKSPSLGLNLFLKDFITPDLISSRGLPVVLRDNLWNKSANMYPGLSITYLEGLTQYIDFAANLHASFTNYQFNDGSKQGQNKFLLEADANIRVKLLTDKYFIVPYLTAGLGQSMYGGTYFSAYLPVGVGAQYKLGEGNFINVGMNYNIRLTNYSSYHFQYYLGFVTPIFEKKPARVVAAIPPPPPAKPELKDTDKDGIKDNVDKCPTIPGIAKYKGCPVPDTDKDGINDENDKCPTIKGLAKYNGCPIPDTDKDGINDEEDKCPTIPGIAQYNGCPIPDTDADGINDEQDKCPTEKGTAANNGCPEIQDFGIDLNRIHFESGKAFLTKAAVAKLNKIAAILSEHITLSVLVDGYSDSVGKTAANKVLSKKRASAAKVYLVKKGVNAYRLTATGYGSANPVGNNKTAKGKAANRRVELNIKK